MYCQIKQVVMNKEEQKEKKKLKKELEFYLDYYKEVACRSERIKREFDFQIERIIERLKELGR